MKDVLGLVWVVSSDRESVGREGGRGWGEHWMFDLAASNGHATERVRKSPNSINSFVVNSPHRVTLLKT